MKLPAGRPLALVGTGFAILGAALFAVGILTAVVIILLDLPSRGGLLVIALCYYGSLLAALGGAMHVVSFAIAEVRKRLRRRARTTAEIS